MQALARLSEKEFTDATRELEGKQHWWCEHSELMSRMALEFAHGELLGCKPSWKLSHPDLLRCMRWCATPFR